MQDEAREDILCAIEWAAEVVSGADGPSLGTSDGKGGGGEDGEGGGGGGREPGNGGDGEGGDRVGNDEETGDGYCDWARDAGSTDSSSRSSRASAS